MEAHQVVHAVREQAARSPAGFTTYPIQYGTITAVHTSPNTVDVKLDGASTATLGLRYLAGYSPTVGDGVVVMRYASDRFVLGKLA